jgi:hypothetical protein
MQRAVAPRERRLRPEASLVRGEAGRLPGTGETP